MRNAVSLHLYRLVDSLPRSRPKFGVGHGDLGSAPEATGVVFSKDRPMQLDALLRSYKACVTGQVPLEVIYACSSGEYQAAYGEVESAHGTEHVRFHQEVTHGTFRNALASVMSNIETRTLFFLVDDILFIRPLDINAFASLASTRAIPSMRLGRNITWSYTQGRSQDQPSLRRFTVDRGSDRTGQQHTATDLWAWRWRSGSIDWAYPLSVDGNIFVTETIKDLVSSCTYSSPNTLEAALQDSSARMRSAWGVCFDQSRIVNLPINRVQVDYENRHGSTHQDSLLEKWVDGYCLDLSRTANVETSSVHAEIELALVKRGM